MKIKIIANFVWMVLWVIGCWFFVFYLNLDGLYLMIGGIVTMKVAYFVKEFIEDDIV